MLDGFVVNLYSAVFFTKYFMENAEKRQKRSLVIFMSSGSTLGYWGYFNLYGAGMLLASY